MPLNTLPSELLHTILSLLDIPSLLSFSQTNSTNYAHHLHTLHTLHLAVFPKRVQSFIAFLQHSTPTSDCQTANHQVTITLPNRPSKRTHPKTYRHNIIASQNTHLITLISRYAQSLETLTFHAWDILPSTASTLAESCSRLQHLSLCFDHGASRDPCIPTGYFDSPTKASSLWNALAGLGEASEQKLVLRNLVSLRLERAGCTSAQLRWIVARNPGLKELRLQKVRGVDAEFVHWLGSSANRNGANLTVLSIKECANLQLEQTEQYLWLGKLDNLTYLRISGCRHVDERKLKMASEAWNITHVGGYWYEARATGQSNNYDGVMEVDEACL